MSEEVFFLKKEAKTFVKLLRRAEPYIMRAEKLN